VFHIVLLASAATAGIIGGIAGLVSAHARIPVDISENAASTVVDGSQNSEDDIEVHAYPWWYVAVVLAVGALLSLCIFYRSRGILAFLCLYLVFFSLLAISLMDLEWRMIGLDLFVPLTIGTIGWVMLHQISLWLFPVVAILGGGMLVIYLREHRKSHGDLFLAILVSLFAGAGIVTYSSTLVVINQLMLGAFFGAVALLTYSFLKFRNDSETKKTWKQQTTPLAPLFLCSTLAVLFVR